MAEIWVAGAVAGAAVIGAGASIYSSDQQAGAAKNAQAISQGQYQNTVDLENPYNQAGLGATNQLNYLEGIDSYTTDNGQPSPVGAKPGQSVSSGAGGFGSLNTPFTAANFQQLSPAYGFQLQQGQQGVLNADSSNEGALSGAAQKDLQSYSQNFANTSFNNAFNQYQTQNSNVYSRLSNIANLGQSAASGTAQQGTALAGQAAQSSTNIGQAYANGATGVSNAASGYAQNSLLSNYLNNGGSGNATYGGNGIYGGGSASQFSDTDLNNIYGNSSTPISTNLNIPGE